MSGWTSCFHTGLVRSLFSGPLKPALKVRENSGWDAGPGEPGNFSPARAVPTVGGLSPWALEGSVRPSKPGAPEKSQVCTLGGLASGARFFRTVLKACRMVSWLLRTL